MPAGKKLGDFLSLKVAQGTKTPAPDHDLPGTTSKLTAAAQMQRPKL